MPFEAFLGSFVVGEKFDEGFIDFLGPLSSCTAKKGGKIVRKMKAKGMTRMCHKNVRRKKKKIDEGEADT